MLVYRQGLEFVPFPPNLIYAAVVCDEMFVEAKRDVGLITTIVNPVDYVMSTKSLRHKIHIHSTLMDSAMAADDFLSDIRMRLPTEYGISLHWYHVLNHCLVIRHSHNLNRYR